MNTKKEQKQEKQDKGKHKKDQEDCGTWAKHLYKKYVSTYEYPLNF